MKASVPWIYASFFIAAAGFAVIIAEQPREPIRIEYLGMVQGAYDESHADVPTWRVIKGTETNVVVGDGWSVQ